VPSGPTVAGSGQALYALIDDEDDAAVPAARTPPAAAGANAPLYALLDDEPPVSRPPAKTAPSPVKPAASRPTAEAATPSVNLSELADLEDVSAPSAARRRPAPAPVPRALDDGLLPMTNAPQALPRASEESDLRVWIVRGLLVGVAIVLVGFGVQQLIT